VRYIGPAMRILKHLLHSVAASLALSATAIAQSPGKPGDFDYYVLALSWSPAWCATEGRNRQAEQCAPRAETGFVLHGLWPQYDDGWPQNCRRSTRDPSRGDTANMADIMGSAGLAWYQWKKHGRCAGVEPRRYFGMARQAFDEVNRPEILRKIETTMDVPPEVIEAAFLEANPQLSAQGVTVTCRDKMMREVRICLNRDLSPRSCGRGVDRDCRMNAMKVLPIPKR